MKLYTIFSSKININSLRAALEHFALLKNAKSQRRCRAGCLLCRENFKVDAEPEDVLQKFLKKYLRDRCQQSHILSTQAL